MGRMETQVVKLEPQKADMEVLKDAAALLDSGGLVAFPTETVYGIACRVKKDSLNKLHSVKGRGPDKHYTLHIAQRADLKKYVPSLGLRAKKLAEKAWPGPLTMVFELSDTDIETQRGTLDSEVFESLYAGNSIGIRCPDNPIASRLLVLTENAVVAPSANISGQPPAVDADQVLAQFSGEIELLLDGGPCRYKKSSTVAKIGKGGLLEILRPGVHSEAELQAMSTVRFLFVCTGNTCRSPMAVGIFRKYLAEKLGCEVDQVEEMGYKIASAGVTNLAGFPASPEAIAACRVRGIDIRGHRSTQLSQEPVEESDYIFVMGRMHRERVAVLSNKPSERCVLLAENREIPDPIGQSQGFYNSCADLIEEAVKKRIGELVL